MTLAAKSQLGPYEIVSPLGAGGMGEVYRARDSRLGREVAVKVLPAALSSDPERLKRFEKEARSASALNHPNIVTVYDIGSQDGVSYLAMELVSGETLRALVSGGPLPIKKLLAIAPQIAEGLAKAHEAGIVHRDLKPENVMVTNDGLVKILDFGLAKLQGPVSGGSDQESQLPTVTGTSPGIVLGTVGYMSPEQASGKPIDHRSDQFAFGSILYEMATGRRAFQKKTAVETLTAILNDEPEPVATVSPQTPAPVRWIVERCLAKDAGERYDSTRDLSRDLAAVRGHLSEALSDRLVAREGRRRAKAPYLAALAIALLCLAAGIAVDRWIGSRRAATVLPNFRQLTFRQGNILTARFAPDGKTVAYSAAWEGQLAAVYTVRTDSIASTPIGLTGADVLGISSRGELAVLMSKRIFGPGGIGTLARVPLTGGTPRELVEGVTGADWAPNGEDLAIIRALPDGRRRIEYPIGTTLYESGNIGNAIRVSPRGDRLAFVEGNDLVVMDRKGQRRVLAHSLSNYLSWSPSGDEILVTGTLSGGRAIYAVSLSGRPRVLVPAALGLTLHDQAVDGRLLVEDGRERCGIACLPRGEKRERELGWMFYSFVRNISDDGRFIVGMLSEEAGDPNGVYLRQTDGAPAIRLGEGAIQDLSSDGRWVLAISGSPRTVTLIPTGAGLTKKIPIPGAEPQLARLLPDGKGFLIATVDASGNASVGLIGPDGGVPRAVATEGLVSDKSIVISPDGARIAYVGKDRRLKVTTLATGQAATVPGDAVGAGDDPLAWTEEGHVLVGNTSGIPGLIDRVDLTTGRRDRWKTLIPEDPTGITSIALLAVSRDGQSYAYSYIRGFVDDLYVVDGVR